MAKSDFTFVGSPHDPLTISGSDPHTSSLPNIPYLQGDGARLALWQKIEPGYWVTGSGLENTSHGPGANRVYAMFDASGNPESIDRARVGRHMRTVGNNNYNLVYSPCVSASMINKGYLGGDDQWFIMGRTSQQYGGVWMANMYHCADSDLDVDNSANYNWVSEWVSGSGHDSTNSNIAGAAWEGYTHFVVMKHHNNDGTNNRGFQVAYGAERNDSTMGQTQHKTFNIGIEQNTNTAGAADKNRFRIGWNDQGDNASSELNGDASDYGPGFHQLTGWMNRSPGAPLEVRTKIELYHQGRKNSETTLIANSGDTPVIQGQGRFASIGSNDTNNGSGFINDPDAAGAIDESQPNNAHFNGLAEWFVFDNALSVQRRQQMEKYLCDKYGLEMSGSDYLSQFEGGAEGTAQVHSALSNALGSNGTYARKYVQAATSSMDYLIQHETVGGGFLKSTADSGNFYKVQSESAISLRMHVRAESLNDSHHTGSQVALVAKATSPFGHQIDNIKGYAIKFGTLKDGYDTGDTPSFRLSLRNSAQYYDGGIMESCGDIDLSNDSLTPAVDTWYSMRIDVIPSGHSFDRIKAYAKAASSGTWLALKDGSDNTHWDIERTDANYRYWVDDNKFNEKRVPIQNGVHNGYYVSLSSSSGHTAGTAYYVDGFTAKLDTV